MYEERMDLKMMFDIEMSDAEVLMRLYNGARQQGLGLLNKRGKSQMTLQEAEDLLAEEGTCFDYLYGRVMKIDVAHRPLDVRLYERDNGPDTELDALTAPYPPTEEDDQ